VLSSDSLDLRPSWILRLSRKGWLSLILKLKYSLVPPALRSKLHFRNPWSTGLPTNVLYFQRVPPQVQSHPPCPSFHRVQRFCSLVQDFFENLGQSTGPLHSSSALIPCAQVQDPPFLFPSNSPFLALKFNTPLSCPQVQRFCPLVQDFFENLGQSTGPLHLSSTLTFSFSGS